MSTPLVVRELLRRSPMVESRQQVSSLDVVSAVSPEDIEARTVSRVVGQFAEFLAQRVIAGGLIERDAREGGDVFRLSLVVLTPFEQRELLMAAHEAGKREAMASVMEAGNA